MFLSSFNEARSLIRVASILQRTTPVAPLATTNRADGNGVTAKQSRLSRETLPPNQKRNPAEAGFRNDAVAQALSPFLDHQRDLGTLGIDDCAVKNL